MRPSPDTCPSLRLLHYWWPVAMGGSMAVVVHRAIARPVDASGLALLLCGILAAYSIDRILDGPDITQPAWLTPALRTAAVAAVVAGMVLLTRVPLRTGALVPVLGALVLAYPRLKSTPLLKTLLVSAVWTWSSIALPFHDGSWLGWRALTVPVAAPLILILASGCLLCDLKDVTADRESSVSSLPVLLGVHWTVAVAVVLAVLGAGIAMAEHRIGLSVGGVGLGLAALHPRLLARDAIGPLMIDAILTVPGLLIALHVV